MKSMLWFVCLSALMSGCGTVVRQVDVEDAKVSGPMNHPPVYVTMDSARSLVRFSPRFSVNRNRRLTGSIDAESDQDPAKTGGLQWSLPDFTIGLGADIGLGRSGGSLTLGGEYGNADGHDAWNGYAGLAIHEAGPAIGFRLEAGLFLRSLRHDARTVVVTTSDFLFFGTSTNTMAYHDRGDDRALDFYAQMTLNTIIKRSPVNLFACTGIVRQTLFKYRPSTVSETWLIVPVDVTESGTDVKCRVVLFSLTPGLSLSPGRHYTVLAGWRMMWPLGGHLDPKPAAAPFLQLDFAL
jgi:hypothetical protein